MIKRGLALSGGGEKGAYQVGALKALYFDAGRTYDVLAGVSVGAINAAHQAQYPKHEEAKGWRDLHELWMGLTDDKVYKRWRPFGILQALFNRSLYNSSSLLKYLRERLDERAIAQSGHELRVGATSLTTGDFRIFNEKQEPLSDLVYASAAFPVAFGPAEIAGEWWADGAIRTATPVKACIEAGCTHIDVVMLTPRKVRQVFDSTPGIVDIATRAIALMTAEITENDLEQAMLWNHLIERGEPTNKRHIEFTVVRPEEVLPTKLLHFDPAVSAELVELGYRDGVQALTM